MIWQFLQLMFAFVLFGYVCGLLLDFLLELKMSNLYKQKQSAIRCVQHMGRSMAVVSAKTFKIEMDYAAKALLTEKKRKFIRNLVLNR